MLLILFCCNKEASEEMKNRIVKDRMFSEQLELNLKKLDIQSLDKSKEDECYRLIKASSALMPQYQYVVVKGEKENGLLIQRSVDSAKKYKNDTVSINYVQIVNIENILKSIDYWKMSRDTTTAVGDGVSYYFEGKCYRNYNIIKRYSPKKNERLNILIQYFNDLEKEIKYSKTESLLQVLSPFPLI